MAVIDDIRNFNWYCHGIPERCLIYNGKRMAICARCFGSNIGHLFALGLFIFQCLPPWYLGLLLLGIMFTDWGAQEFFGKMSNNPRRVVTGILGGFGMGILIWNFFSWACHLIIVLISWVMKDRWTAIGFAFVLGGLGVHRFYLGQFLSGVLYLFFCWTFIPTLIALVDGFVWIAQDDNWFDQRYNGFISKWKTFFDTL